MSLLAVGLALAGLGQVSPAANPMAGSFCSGIAWVTVRDRRNLSVDHGDDFRVFRYDRSPSEWWVIYSGREAQVPGGTKKLFFKRHGIRVSSIHLDGEFRGYVAVARDGRQNHFYGSPFHDDPGDKAFFDQVDFGPTGVANCKKHRMP